MLPSRFARLSSVSLRWIWYGLVALLPVTSMPVLVRLVGSDTVAAPSGILLFLLVVFWLVPYLYRRGRLPRQSLPLLLLALFAIFSIGLSTFRDLPMFKGINPLRNELEALVTLGIGICFFLAASTFPKDEKTLTTTLKIIHWTGLLILLWSFAQAAAWALNNRYPGWMRDFQDLISVGPLYRQRVTGFALEPSWLAHQLNMLYLPLWLAFSVRRVSLYRFRALGLTFENLLLAAGFAALMLTLSRVGQLAFFLMIGYLLILANFRIARWIQSRAEAGSREKKTGLSQGKRSLMYAGILLGMVIFYLGGLLGVAYVMSRVDPRMRDVFFFDYGHDNPLLRYANQLTFASRMVYWQGGWEVFNEHPIIGAGLGNAGFYFREKLSGFAWGLVEVRDLMFRSGNLLNIKSIWVRLLAETGAIGFSLFVSWLFLYYNTSRSLLQNRPEWVGAIALFGQLVVVSIIIEGFSVDSFALPYLWISSGLVTATYRLCRGSLIKE